MFNKVEMQDTLTSLIGGLGDPARDKLAGASYAHTVLSDETLRTVYASSWMIRKAVNIPAQDATRKWRTWQGETADTAAMTKTEQAFGLRRKVRAAKILARQYGGAAIVIGDGADDTTQPLDVEKMQRGGLKYLSVMPRREIRAGELTRDVGSEYFGMPEKYSYSNGTSQVIDFHPSRLAIFEGAECVDPWQQYGVNRGWGDSIITAIYEAMKQGDSALANVASLVFEANVDVISIPDLMQMANDPDYEQKFLKRTTLAAAAKGINRTLILDALEKYERKSANFSGLDKVIDQFLRVCAGAADIPMTRFMSQSPAGLSATGDGDMRNYYDMVQTIQTTELTPSLLTLDRALQRTTFGAEPEGMTHAWAPLEQMSEKDQAEIGAKHAETASKLIMSGVYDAEEMEQALTPVLTEIGVYPNMSAIMADRPDDDTDDLGGDDPLDVPGDETTEVGDAASPPKPLYVYRPVVNGAEILKYYIDQGITSTLKPDDLHVTIIYSKRPVDWLKMGSPWDDEIKVPAGGPRVMQQFNDALVLSFANHSLEWRHERMVENGASFDYSEYTPHVTIGYGNDVDVETLEAYQGEIILGPETFQDLNDDWKPA